PARGRPRRPRGVRAARLRAGADDPRPRLGARATGCQRGRHRRARDRDRRRHRPGGQAPVGAGRRTARAGAAHRRRQHRRRARPAQGRRTGARRARAHPRHRLRRQRRQPLGVRPAGAAAGRRRRDRRGDPGADRRDDRRQGVPGPRHRGPGRDLRRDRPDRAGAPRRAPGAPAAGALSVAAGRRARLRVAVAARAQAGGGMSALHFLRPEWLWLLLALPPLAWWLRRDAARTGPWPREVDAHLLPHLLAPVRGLRGGGRAWLVSPLLALAIVALAGPSWSRVQQPLWQSRAPLVLALDLSGAMLAGDLPPSRLARARAKVDTLLEQRRDGEVGLLVFHQDAYVVAPLTDDAANVALFLDALPPDIMPEALEATAPSDAAPAIGQAMALLRQAGFSHGDILLLTDHAGGDAIAAATGAAAAGYRVSALGLGTARGASWRHPRGDILQARLDAGSLQALARAGNGGYAPLAADASDLAELGVLVPRDVDPGAGGESGMLAWQ